MFSRFVSTSRGVSRFSTKPCFVQQRNLNIHEYQGQALMRKFNVAVPDGGAASTVEEAEKIAKSLG